MSSQIIKIIAMEFMNRSYHRNSIIDKKKKFIHFWHDLDWCHGICKLFISHTKKKSYIFDIWNQFNQRIAHKNTNAIFLWIQWYGLRSNIWNLYQRDPFEWTSYNFTSLSLFSSPVSIFSDGLTDVTQTKDQLKALLHVKEQECNTLKRQLVRKRRRWLW